MPPTELRRIEEHLTTPSRTFRWLPSALRAKVTSLSRPEAPLSSVLRRAPHTRFVPLTPQHVFELLTPVNSSEALTHFLCLSAAPCYYFSLEFKTQVHILLISGNIGAEVANYPVTEITYLE